MCTSRVRGFFWCMSLGNQCSQCLTKIFSWAKKRIMEIMIVNNTDADIYPWLGAFIEAAKTDSVLPEEIRDIFSLKVLDLNGTRRGIVTWA